MIYFMGDHGSDMCRFKRTVQRIRDNRRLSMNNILSEMCIRHRNKRHKNELRPTENVSQ